MLAIHLRNWLLAALAGSLAGCTTHNYQRIDDHFQFGYEDTREYTNVYCDGLPVVAGGCDNAKWDGDVIVARGLRVNHSYDWSPQARTISGEACYFIIHKAHYLRGPGLQEHNPGFTGPLSAAEFAGQDPLPGQGFQTPAY